MKRIGSVSYLNAIPLVYYIKGFELIKDVPSKLCGLFHKEKLDVALLPIYEVLTNQNYIIIDGISISSKEKSGSVILFLNKSINEVKKITCDTSSKTSVHLLKLLGIQYFKQNYEYNLQDPKNILQNYENYDAYLLIGDNAIYHQKIHNQFIDLGNIWYQWFNLPFVYAVWVLRNKDPELKEVLFESKKKGIENLDDLIRISDFKDKYFLEVYYKNCLSYNLNQDEKKSIELYQNLLFDNLLIEKKINMNYY